MQEHLAALEREKEREERRRIELEELRIQEEEAAEDRRKAEEEARKKAEGLYMKTFVTHAYQTHNIMMSITFLSLLHIQRRLKCWRRYANRKRRNGRWHYLENCLVLVKLQ